SSPTGAHLTVVGGAPTRGAASLVQHATAKGTHGQRHRGVHVGGARLGAGVLGIGRADGGGVGPLGGADPPIAYDAERLRAPARDLAGLKQRTTGKVTRGDGNGAAEGLTALP